jgi:hypothetical protein
VLKSGESLINDSAGDDDLDIVLPIGASRWAWSCALQENLPAGEAWAKRVIFAIQEQSVQKKSPTPQGEGDLIKLATSRGRVRC